MNILHGSSGADVLTGTDLPDVVLGNGGDDTITGNGGADTFTFHAVQAGNDTITDFGPDDDIVSLVGVGHGFDPMAHLNETSAGVVLSLGEGVHVTFTGVDAADLTAADFLLG